MFDGILFEEHEGVNAKLQRAQAHIRKCFGWSHFKFDEKPFDCGWHEPCEAANKSIINAKFRALEKQFCACMMESKAKVIDMCALDDTADRKQHKHLFYDHQQFITGLSRRHSGVLLYKSPFKDEDEWCGKLLPCSSIGKKNGGGNVCAR